MWLLPSDNRAWDFEVICNGGLANLFSLQVFAGFKI